MRDKQRTDVLVISQLPPPVHGSTLMTQTFFRTLDTLGFSWFLVDRRFSTRVDQVGKFGFGKAISAVGLGFRLASSLFQQKPRVVVFFSTTRKFSFLVDWLLSELLRFRKAKTILYMHTVGYHSLAEQGRFWKCLVSRLLGAAEDIVVLDESLAWDVISFTEANITAIPNMLPEFPPPVSRYVPLEERKLVLYLSNLIAGKGYEDFLEIAIRALNSGIQNDFVLAGASSVEIATAVQRRIDISGHQAHIKLAGAVKSDEKWELLNSAKLLLFPSMNETFALVLLEAAACGVPIVSYSTGALAPKLFEERAATLVEAGDLDALYEEFLAVIGDNMKLHEMSASGKRLSISVFSEEQYASSWNSLLSRTL